MSLLHRRTNLLVVEYVSSESTRWKPFGVGNLTWDNPHTFLIEMLKWFSHKFGVWPMLMNLISILCSFRFSCNMGNEIIFGNNVGIWDSWETERVMIGSGTYKDPSPILIYATSCVETCIMVLVETMLRPLRSVNFLF